MRGFRQIFAFTLQQQFRSKGYRTITILIAVLLLLLPAAIMPAVEAFGGGDEVQEGAVYSSIAVPQVYFADDSAGASADFSFFSQLGISGVESIEFIGCEDLDSALEKASASPYSLVLHITGDESGFQLELVLPENSTLTEDDASAFGSLLTSSFDYVLAQKAGLSPEQLSALAQPVASSTEGGGQTGGSGEEYDPLSIVREVFSMLLPYVNIMLIYFMVLFYGQGVASCVIMEKSSKLMDTFLVSVQPKAMVFGKVLAICLSSAAQFLLWVVALFSGFALGTALVLHINPYTDMLLIQFFRLFGSVSGIFSVSGAVIAVLMVLAGFLLYCSIAAIGGSLAGKSEDLSSTNVLFILILIVSFFCTLGSGFLSGETATGVTWMDIVPFTAILITPSRLLLGSLSPVMGLVSLLVVLIVSALIMLLSGRIYKLMSLYKGNPPKPKQLVNMLKGK